MPKTKRKRTKPTVKGLARKVARLEKAPEFKRIEIFDSDFPPLTGTLTALHDVDEGVTSSDRVGISINARTLQIKMEIKMNTISTQLNQYVRMLLFKDMQQDGDTLPTITDVMGASASSSTDFRSWTQRDRFRVYYDRTHYVGNTSEGRPALVLVDEFVRLNHKISYNGSLGTDIQKNGVYVLLIGSENGNPPTVTWESRLTFTDQ